MKKLIRNIFLLLNLIPVFGILLSYLSIYISPVRFWALAFLGLSYPYFLLVNLLFILLWLFFRPRYALISLLAIISGFQHFSDYVQLRPKTTEKQGIHICSFNVKNFYGEDPLNTKKANAIDIVNYLKDLDAQIICLQEVKFIRDRQEQVFNSKYELILTNSKYFVHNIHSGAPATYTTFPIVGKGEILFSDSPNMVIYTDLKVGIDTIRVYNCHLQSYGIKPYEINSLDSLSFNKQEQSIRDVKKVGSKLKHAFVKRTKQANQLREHISLSPYPVIVCGDFNDTPVSYAYHKVRGGLKDAFVESGRGIGNTYLGKLPSFRIDYILHSNEFDSFNFEVDKIKLSDHYPINCTLVTNF